MASVHYPTLDPTRLPPRWLRILDALAAAGGALGQGRLQRIVNRPNRRWRSECVLTFRDMRRMADAGLIDWLRPKWGLTPRGRRLQALATAGAQPPRRKAA